jgi:hypothetical protein
MFLCHKQLTENKRLGIRISIDAASSSNQAEAIPMSINPLTAWRPST